jgi:acyl phosphate:glycerol-3-phosphate acyltransferase
MVTGFVGLGTMLAFATLPLAIVIGGLAGREALLLFLLALAAFIVYTHRGNVARMLRHEEHRMNKLMLLRRRSARP